MGLVSVDARLERRSAKGRRLRTVGDGAVVRLLKVAIVREGIGYSRQVGLVHLLGDGIVEALVCQISQYWVAYSCEIHMFGELATHRPRKDLVRFRGPCPRQLRVELCCDSGDECSHGDEICC